MAKAEGFNLSEQILFYGLRKPEKLPRGKRMDITPEAYEIADRAVNKDKEYFQEEFRNNNLINSLRLDNFEAISIFLADTRNRSSIPVNSLMELEQFYFNYIDGFALVTMRDLNKGNTLLKKAVERKDGNLVEKIYGVPPELKGIGKVIIGSQITDERLITEINLLQIGLSSGRANLNRWEKAYDVVSEVYRQGKTEIKEQAVLVLTYLSSMMEGMPSSVKTTVGEKADLIEEIKGLREDEKKRQSEVERQDRERGEQERREKEEKDERERLEYFELMWDFKGPETERKSALDADWSKKIEGLKRIKINELNNAVAGKAKHAGGDLKQMLSLGEKDIPRGEGIFVADNRELNEIIYNIPGVAQNLKEILNIFFEPGTENGEFVLNMKQNSDTDRYYSDRNELLVDLVHKFSRSPSLKDRADATEAAAIALGLLWTGNTWESAGKGKTTTFSSHSMTYFMFPNSRAFNKINNQEIWGGDRLGGWLVRGKRQADNGNKDYAKFMDDWKNGRLHPFPKRLFYSFWEIEEIKTEGGEKMKMAQAFYEGKKIDFANSGDGISTNFFINDYFDYAKTMLKLYDYAIGNNVLKVDEAGKWVTELNGLVVKGREKELISPYIDREFIRWAIAASYEIGLLPLKDTTTLLNHYRSIPTLGTLFDVLLGGMNERVLDKEEKRMIREAFLVDDALGRGWKIMKGLAT